MDYIVPGLLGFLTGAVIFGLTYQQVYPVISAIANYGNVNMPDLWNVSSFLFIMGMFASGILTALIIYRRQY